MIISCNAGSIEEKVTIEAPAQRIAKSLNVPGSFALRRASNVGDCLRITRNHEIDAVSDFFAIQPSAPKLTDRTRIAEAEIFTSDQ
jgi:hypothetical protein